MHLRPLDGSEGPKTPILIPYTKLSLFDFDQADDGLGREVSRPPWLPPVLAAGRLLSLTTSQCVEASGYYNYAHSEPDILPTQLTGGNTYDPTTGLNSGREATRLRPVLPSRVSPERLPPPFQGDGALLRKGKLATTQRKQWSK